MRFVLASARRRTAPCRGAATARALSIHRRTGLRRATGVRRGRFAAHRRIRQAGGQSSEARTDRAGFPAGRFREIPRPNDGHARHIADTRSGSLNQAYAFSLDVLSLESRAVRDMLPLDAAKARELFLANRAANAGAAFLRRRAGLRLSRAYYQALDSASSMAPSLPRRAPSRITSTSCSTIWAKPHRQRNSPRSCRCRRKCGCHGGAAPDPLGPI